MSTYGFIWACVGEKTHNKFKHGLKWFWTHMLYQNGSKVHVFSVKVELNSDPTCKGGDKMRKKYY